MVPSILMHYIIKAIKPVGRYKVLHGLADILTGLSASAVASTNYITYRERRADIEALVMEEIVSEKILASAKAVEKMMTYDQVVNPEKTKENKGA